MWPKNHTRYIIIRASTTTTTTTIGGRRTTTAEVGVVAVTVAGIKKRADDT